MPTPLRAILTVLGAAAVLTGCGGEDPTVDRDGVLRIRLEEYRMVPQELQVRAGNIRIVARNAGRLTHNVKVEEDTQEEGATPIVYGGTPTAKEGETVGETIRLFPGRYRLVCTIGNHENLGQYAELEVIAAGS